MAINIKSYFTLDNIDSLTTRNKAYLINKYHSKNWQSNNTKTLNWSLQDDAYIKLKQWYSMIDQKMRIILPITF